MINIDFNLKNSLSDITIAKNKFGSFVSKLFTELSFRGEIFNFLKKLGFEQVDDEKKLNSELKRELDFIKLNSIHLKNLKSSEQEKNAWDGLFMAKDHEIDLINLRGFKNIKATWIPIKI